MGEKVETDPGGLLRPFTSVQCITVVFLNNTDPTWPGPVVLWPKTQNLTSNANLVPAAQWRCSSHLTWACFSTYSKANGIRFHSSQRTNWLYCCLLANTAIRQSVLQTLYSKQIDKTVNLFTISGLKWLAKMCQEAAYCGGLRGVL